VYQQQQGQRSSNNLPCPWNDSPTYVKPTMNYEVLPYWRNCNDKSMTTTNTNARAVQADKNINHDEYNHDQGYFLLF
jgi:hypothetical protein